MKMILPFLLLFFALPASAAELYSPTPYCADIKNETADKAFVAIRTAFFAKPDGSQSYHEEVMHLDVGQSKQLCAKGPFFPDYKVSLIVKSFFPLFECKTKLSGTITVREKPRADGGRDFYATCVD